MEMGRYSLSQHPIWGRVLARHRRTRGVAFADDSYICASLKAALQVFVEIRQRLGEDAKLRLTSLSSAASEPVNLELVRQHIERDPSLANLRELYD